jgi:alpha-ribazole phosphatase/probable phosphoglycerate mutase
MTATRLILVRHGEPSDCHGICYGRRDVPLSSTGREQMTRARALVSCAGRVAVYSSTLQRSLDSAIAFAGHSAGVTVDARLCELDFGAVEGLAYTEIEARYPDLFQKWMQGPTTVTFPDGEPVAVMAARVRHAAADLRRIHAGATAVVVTHGGVNRILLADALGMPLEAMFRLAQDYGCINVIDYFDHHAIVRAMNVRDGAIC